MDPSALYRALYEMECSLTRTLVEIASISLLAYAAAMCLALAADLVRDRHLRERILRLSLRAWRLRVRQLRLRGVDLAFRSWGGVLSVWRFFRWHRLPRVLLGASILCILLLMTPLAVRYRRCPHISTQIVPGSTQEKSEMLQPLRAGVPVHVVGIERFARQLVEPPERVHLQLHPLVVLLWVAILVVLGCLLRMRLRSSSRSLRQVPSSAPRRRLRVKTTVQNLREEQEGVHPHRVGLRACLVELQNRAM